MTTSVREFTSLKIRRRLLGAGGACKYRIYRSHSDFITLEARTATEACKVSGIKRPYKIVRVSPSSMKMLDSKVFEGGLEDVVETSKLNAEEGVEPIIIPAPPASGARIIDDYDIEGSGGGFMQVSLASMGARNAEDTAALKKVVEEIASDTQESAVMERPVIITPDMITLDVSPGTNEPVMRIVPPELEQATASTPVKKASPVDDLEQMLTSAYAKNPQPAGPVPVQPKGTLQEEVEKGIVRMDDTLDVETPLVAKADIPKTPRIQPEAADAPQSKELTQEEISKLLGE